MADNPAVAETPVAASAPGIAPSGQGGADATTPEAAKNQQTASATPSAQAPDPSTPKYRFKDQAEAERAHSENQSRYAKHFGPDLDRAAEEFALWQKVRNEPWFRTAAQAELAKHEAGADDPETVRALQIVESVSERKARELVAPLFAQMAQARLAAVGQAMQREHGAEWLEAKADMDALFIKGAQAGVFAQNSNPYLNYEITSALYKAVRGDAREAKAYQKKLEAKQASTTQSTPGLAPAATAPSQTKGIEGAVRAAMKQHGLA